MLSIRRFVLPKFCLFIITIVFSLLNICLICKLKNKDAKQSSFIGIQLLIESSAEHLLILNICNFVYFNAIKRLTCNIFINQILGIIFVAAIVSWSFSMELIDTVFHCRLGIDPNPVDIFTGMKHYSIFMESESALIMNFVYQLLGAYLLYMMLYALMQYSFRTRISRMEVLFSIIALGLLLQFGYWMPIGIVKFISIRK